MVFWKVEFKVVEYVGGGVVLRLIMSFKMFKEERRFNGCVRWKKNVGELGEDGGNMGWLFGV